MTDREHVLPKSKPAYRALSYAPWNLAAACKRCNMQFKKNTDRFVVECDDPSALMDSASYRFVHPNFDKWENHLTRLGFQIGTNNLIKFFKKQGSDKAPYAYDFFDLRALEVDSFDTAQGLDNRPEMTAAVAAFHQFAASYGQ